MQFLLQAEVDLPFAFDFQEQGLAKIESATNCSPISAKYNPFAESDRGCRKGHWTQQQKLKYHLFLQIYHNHFEKRHLRRIDKIFKVMAQFIGTRAADQCRSHHQKLQKKYLSFHQIIKGLRKSNFNSLESGPVLQSLRRLNQQTSDVLQLKQLQELKEDDFCQDQMLGIFKI